MRIIITGTSSGIGRGLAQRFCEAGHDVWGIARREQSAFALEQQSAGRSFRATCADISQWDQIESWSREVAEAWGSADALVCAAGVQRPLGPAMQLTAEEWAQNLSINLNGTFNTLRAAHPLLLRAQRRAKIVCFSGGGATGPRPFFTPYAVAKAGVVRLVENLAHEWAGLPVDINALAPGAVNTRMTDSPFPAGVLNSSNFKSSERTLAAVLGTRSCNSNSAALSNGQAMNRRCMGWSCNKLTSPSRLIP